VRVGVMQPKENLFRSSAFIRSALVALLLPGQRHWGEDAMPFLLAALPFASPRT